MNALLSRPVPRRVLVLLAALVALAAAAFVTLGATAPEPLQHRQPVLGDAGGSYRPGSLPGNDGDALAVAVRALPLALGYDYRTLTPGLAKATALMTPAFGAEFRRTFLGSAAELARSKQAVASATVRSAGVVRREKGRVLCLVFVDQALVSSSTMKESSAPVRVAQNRVLVGLSRQGGSWKVDSIQPF